MFKALLNFDKIDKKWKYYFFSMLTHFLVWKCIGISSSKVSSVIVDVEIKLDQEISTQQTLNRQVKRKEIVKGVINPVGLVEKYFKHNNITNRDIEEIGFDDLESSSHLLQNSKKLSYLNQMDSGTGDSSVTIMSAYVKTIEQEILKNRNYPIDLRKRGLEGIVKIQFIIFADGKIDSIKIVSSSNVEGLDKAAISLVEAVSLKLPFPKNLELEFLTLIIPIKYNLY